MQQLLFPKASTLCHLGNTILFSIIWTYNSPKYNIRIICCTVLHLLRISWCQNDTATSFPINLNLVAVSVWEIPHTTMLVFKPCTNALQLSLSVRASDFNAKSSERELSHCKLGHQHSSFSLMQLRFEYQCQHIRWCVVTGADM